MVKVRTILVPTDFSEPADAAWNYARGLAERFGSRLHLLHVISHQPFAYDPWGTDNITLRVADLLKETQAGVDKALAARVPRGRLGRRTRTEAAIGAPVDRILQAIRATRADLVVMGTHGRGVVGHMLLGSVAERVVRQSPVPVLTIRKAARKAKAKRARS